MRILILGSGGREHALAWKISESNQCDALFIAPGNAGTEEIATNINIGVNDFPSIANFIEKENINLLVVGPEEPLVNGVKDYLENTFENLAIAGPGKAAAMLEGSKEFSKEFMIRNDIPTAAYKSFSKETISEGKEFIKSLKPPYVLKADGLAAGKGVIISEKENHALSEFEEMLNGKFGQAGNTVVIEEFLKGIEVSVFVLTDGEDYVILPEAKDYKRIYDGDKGPNTGGMGAVSPVPFADESFMKKVKERIIDKTIDGFRKENIDYRGFIFIGLMNIDGEPFVIEYNVRMGDPETQAVLTRINSDLLLLLYKAATKNLKGEKIDISDKTACTVVMASGGYPGSYNKGEEIKGLKDISQSKVFFAGVKKEDEKYLTNGGRVLAVTSNGETLEKAMERSYNSVEKITWNGVSFRRDIGRDILNFKVK